ncbi:hypothetical protein CYMTET_23998 [Cymbomonas tetramitiformis]|uniref:S-formylglutathione hydrolase n=1 Tax=Cymbomonas tetramitiformis TaxID=36881 RepID=A0AAE0FWR7_9CHLO|nr:hypothetical protein CYMTET_23998 [Cymbomonas tetramitiformis]
MANVLKEAMAEIAKLNEQDRTKKKPVCFPGKLEGSPLKTNSKLKQIEKNHSHAGFHYRFEHKSDCLHVDAQRFSVYIPDQTPAATLYILPGAKGEDHSLAKEVGALMFKVASELALALVFPDSSPRGYAMEEGMVAAPLAVQKDHTIPFYMNATKAPWSKYVNMYDYVLKELPDIMLQEFGDWYNPSKVSIMGHSMGGGGALVFALRNPEVYRSVSAISPPLRQSIQAFPKLAFEAFFSDPASESKKHCCYELVKAGHKPPGPILIHTGDREHIASSGGDFEDICREKDSFEARFSGMCSVLMPRAQ